MLNCQKKFLANRQSTEPFDPTVLDRYHRGCQDHEHFRWWHHCYYYSNPTWRFTQSTLPYVLRFVETHKALNEKET